MLKIRYIILFTLLLGVSGCSSVLQRPSEGVAKYMLPEYREYIKKDVTLTDKEKTRRYNAIDAYIKLVRDNMP